MRLPAKTPAKKVAPVEPRPILTPWLPADTLADGQPVGVIVEILEGVPDKPTWTLPALFPTERYTEPAFGFVGTPKKYSDKGIVVDRSNPFILRAWCRVAMPAGDYRVLLRSRGATRLFLDDKLLLETPFIRSFADGHEPVPELPQAEEPGLRPLPVGHSERLVTINLDGRPHDFRCESFVGGDWLRPETGELSVAIAPAPVSDDSEKARANASQGFRLLAAPPAIDLSDESWTAYAFERRARLSRLDTLARKTRGAGELKRWQERHEQARAVVAARPPVMAPQVSPRYPVYNDIDRFLGSRLEQARIEVGPLADDEAFLRRITLDLVGVIPTRAEVEQFAKSGTSEERLVARRQTIDRLLADPRWADQWMGYWQDVLAENPGILKPVLNNSGPFRWWLHESFRDNKPADRFATELVMMEGSKYGGAPAGFAVATENDAPMAAKAQTLAKAFLGVEMQCARCHDAPYHPIKQAELFGLAAMLAGSPVKLPGVGLVAPAPGARKPLVTFTLKPGTDIAPAWPFSALVPEEPVAEPQAASEDEDEEEPPPAKPAPSARERFATLLTSPANDRFAQVLVNRLWKRYMGWGLVEPVDDWNNAEPSHPELLEWLGRELVSHDYDLKHVARLILSSHAYQRAIAPQSSSSAPAPKDRLFASPARRRMSAEQLVDSLFSAAGKPLGSEELNLDIDGRRQIYVFLNLGTPERAWEFTSLSNERDRPALSMPVAQSIVDVLMAFGWRESRPNPLTVREELVTPTEPLILANGVMGSRIVRLSDDSALTALCLEDRPLEELIDAVCRQVLSRRATLRERTTFRALLSDGYATRRVAGATKPRTAARTAVSWSNHLSPEASRIKLEMERAARAGDPPTARLTSDWRERMEDVVWALVNSPEFVFLP